MMKIAFIITLLLCGIFTAFATGFVVFENTFVHPIKISWNAWFVFFFLIGSIIWFFDENKIKIQYPINLNNLCSIHVGDAETFIEIRNLGEKIQTEIVFKCLKQDLEFGIMLLNQTRTQRYADKKTGEIIKTNSEENQAVWTALKRLTAMGLAKMIISPETELSYSGKLDLTSKKFDANPDGKRYDMYGYYRFAITGDGLTTNNIYWYRCKKGMISFLQVWGGYIGYVIAVLSLIVTINSLSN